MPWRTAHGVCLLLTIFPAGVIASSRQDLALVRPIGAVHGEPERSVERERARVLCRDEEHPGRDPVVREQGETLGGRQTQRSGELVGEPAYMSPA